MVWFGASVGVSVAHAIAILSWKSAASLLQNGEQRDGNDTRVPQRLPTSVAWMLRLHTFSVVHLMGASRRLSSHLIALK